MMPARRVQTSQDRESRLMKNRKFGLLVALLAAMPAVADTDIDRTLEADPEGEVSVSNVAGSVEVEGWDRDEVHLSGSVGDDVEDVFFERDGRDVRIRIKAPDSGWGRQDVSADLTIRVPRLSDLDISTVSADIEVENVRGLLDLQSVSGDIEADAFARDIQAETVSGDVEIESMNGDSAAEWDLSTVSGDILATGVSGQIEMVAVSGDLEISGGRFDRVRAETVNGDITWAAGLERGARMDMESVNGTVDVEFAGEVSASIEIETFNGRIKNCFGPKPERTSKYAPGLELSFKEGDGSARVSISTLNGNVSLCGQ